MQARIFFLVMVGEVLLVSGLFLLYPRIARKGLLFGVYVGEKTFDGEAARQITRSWYRGMIGCTVASVAIGVVGGIAVPHPLLAPLPVLLLVVAFLGLYLRAYRQARALAPEGPPPPAVAPLAVIPAPSPVLPALALASGVVLGLVAFVYAGAHYADLPARVPTHFGPSGAPDAWRPKSFSTVMLLPLLALIVGAFLGAIAWLTAHAKRALRRADEGASLVAQMRFRRAMTRFLCGLTAITSAMLCFISIESVRVGLGLAAGLGPAAMGLAGVMVAYALGGTIYIALRYGQGGARLERAGAADDAPLTDGLADNRNWVLGMFYVNREDPSFLVEHRFGLGYTLNLGNWRAVALLGGFLAVVIGLAVVAIVTS